MCVILSICILKHSVPRHGSWKHQFEFSSVAGDFEAIKRINKVQSQRKERTKSILQPRSISVCQTKQNSFESYRVSWLMFMARIGCFLKDIQRRQSHLQRTFSVFPHHLNKSVLAAQVSLHEPLPNVQHLPTNQR